MASHEAHKTAQDPLTLANTFSACVECFGLIHGGQKWDRAEHLELTKLGIQQGRLLAWGDAVGVCGFGDARDARLDQPDTRETIDAALKAIIDRPQHTDRITQFEKFGLKPPKRSFSTFEPALDFNRLEAFREKLYFMREQHRMVGEPRRGKSVTYTHWQIVDINKFSAFVNLIRDNVDLLVELTSVRDKVDMAIRHDVKAFGWHPVFERGRASRDMSKLRMIRDATKHEYPSYAAAADAALIQLDQEWKDHYQAVMEKKPTSTEIPLAASKQMAAAHKAEQHKDGERRSSLFDLFRPKHKRKHSRQEVGGKSRPETPINAQSDAPRSKSLGHATEDDDDVGDNVLGHARSKSISVLPFSTTSPFSIGVVEEVDDDIDPLARVDTSKSLAKMNLEPVSSMISRRDQAYLHMHRASVA